MKLFHIEKYPFHNSQHKEFQDNQIAIINKNHAFHLKNPTKKWLTTIS